MASRNKATRRICLTINSPPTQRRLEARAGDGTLQRARRMLPFDYQEFPPSPALAGHVRCYWRGVSRVAPFETPLPQRVLPDGCTDIVLHLADAGRSLRSVDVVGTMTRPLLLTLDAPAEHLGIRFHPGCASAFFGISADELTDRSAGLDTLWAGADAGEQLAGQRSLDARLRWLERQLLRRLDRVAGTALLAKRVAALIRETGGRLRIDELTARTGCTRQYLGRVFAEHLGVSPKHYARIERFVQLAKRVDRTPAAGWADLAAEHGYYDQAHLIHEFREFTGLAPETYLATEAG